MQKQLFDSLEHIAGQFSPIGDNKILVHWWGSEKDQPYLSHFTDALKANHKDVTTILYDFEQVISKFNETASTDIAELSNDHMAQSTFEVQKSHTNIIDICTFSPPSLLGEILDDGKPAFIQYMRGLFQTMTNPEKQYVQLRLPSSELAEESGIPFETYEALWHELVSIDYTALKQNCLDTIALYEGKSKFEIRTGNDCILNFSTLGRTWYSDNGNGDFPAGEVYIAPLEHSAKGSFYTPFTIWEGEHLTDVILTFENGLLVSASHPEILQALEGAPGDALKFAEFGIGLNPNLNYLTGYPLFDEKAIGSCHIAIGMNHLFGGINDSPVHLDFVSPDPSILAKEV